MCLFLVPYLSESSCFLIKHLLITIERVFVNSENAFKQLKLQCYVCGSSLCRGLRKLIPLQSFRTFAEMDCCIESDTVWNPQDCALHTGMSL